MAIFIHLKIYSNNEKRSILCIYDDFFNHKKHFKIIFGQIYKKGPIKLIYSIYIVTHDICFQGSSLCCHQSELALKWKKL